MHIVYQNINYKSRADAQRLVRGERRTTNTYSAPMVY